MARLTFLVLSQQASGLQPIVSQDQLVEKRFALKQRKHVHLDTHLFCLRTSLSVCVEQEMGAQ